MKISKVLKYKFRNVRAEINTFSVKLRNHTYDGFGYYDLRSSVPVFVVKRKYPSHRREKYIFPYSPKLLKHCVHNLSDLAKIEESVYLDEFKSKCKRCERKSNLRIPQQAWDETIEELSLYLDEYAKTNSASILDGEEPEK